MDERLEERRRAKAEAVRRAKAVIEAIQADDARRVGSLLAAGADANASFQGERLLVSALRRPPIPRLGLVRALLAAGADPNAGAPLVAASALGDLNTVTLLLAAGAGPDRAFVTGGVPPGSQSALGMAAEIGHAEVARALLDAGADPDGRVTIFVNGKRGVRDVTPLMLAAVKRHPAVVDLLLAGGADPGLVDSRGRSALDFVRGKSKDVDRVRERLRSARPPGPAPGGQPSPAPGLP
jgi:ankyrin repeat protein